MLCRLSVLAALIPAIRDLTINPLVWTDGGAAAIDADVNLNEAPVESEPGYPHLTVCAPPWEEGREVVFGGEALTLRTFVQSDFHPLKRFLGRLSEKTFYLRFHTSVHLSDERICELASLDYAREAAWALAKDGEIHAVARWRLTGEPGEAEFGIVVEDAWQRRGLARVLMAHIETTASERGVTRLCRPRPQGQRGHAGHDDGHGLHPRRRGQPRHRSVGEGHLHPDESPIMARLRHSHSSSWKTQQWPFCPTPISAFSA